MLLITIEDGVKIKDGVKLEVGAKTEDGVKTEDDEIINNVGYFFIGDEYKNLIGKIFKYGLVNGDVYLTNLDN